METVFKTPTYVALKTQGLGNVIGNKKFWYAEILAITTDGGEQYFTRTCYWQETSSGAESKRQESALTRVKQKNIGKANETSLRDQAFSEVNTLVNLQKDKLYIELGQEFPESEILLPMLAHKYEDKKHTFQFPVLCQPKFDGIRSVSNGKSMWSRKGKPLIHDCVKHLLFDSELILDGELILPEEFSFQDSTSAVKKFNENSPKLMHRVYDLVIPNLPFSKRFELLTELSKKFPDNVVLAETVVINSEDELIEYHSQKVSEGWEGVIVRTFDGHYEIAKRSSSLLKYKSFDDDEFEVVGVKSGDGKCENMACLICKTKTGAEFEAFPKGTAEYRKELWANKESLIGQIWTIKYFGYTTNEDPNLVKPRFPIAMNPRDNF